MSLLNGDRARAHKIAAKRRVHRCALRLLRRVSTAVPDQHVVPVVAAAAKPKE